MYVREVQKRYYDNNIEARRKTSLNYYQNHRKERIAYNKQWRLNNSTKVKQDWAARHLEKRNVLDKLKDKPCIDCHVKYPPYVMDFDHLKNKTKNVSNLLYSPLYKLHAEIAKCDLVCSNCHRERTWRRSHGK